PSSHYNGALRASANSGRGGPASEQTACPCAAPVGGGGRVYESRRHLEGPFLRLLARPFQPFHAGNIFEYHPPPRLRRFDEGRQLNAHVVGRKLRIHPAALPTQTAHEVVTFTTLINMVLR